MTSERTALSGGAELMRGLGLSVDGPARWGSPVGGRKPGVFVVELPGGADRAPIDIVVVRRWVEHVPGMKIDGEVATAHEIARRLESLWLPNEPILYVGRSTRSIGQRVAAMYATNLGDSKPYSGGHWLKTLAVLKDLRVWWADTEAHEEYQDALMAAIMERNEGKLPFANLSGTDGKAKVHGIDGSILAEPDPAAGGAKGRAKPTARRTPTTTRRTPSPRLKTSTRAVPEPTRLSREGMERLTAELDDLRLNKRPEVIARVATARSHGDLKENAEYEYARKEQSFMEGRIQALENILRTGVVVEEAPAGEIARVGSTVVVEADGDKDTYLLVSSAEADPKSGRISDVSPVGRALMGARPGDEVTVALPNGKMKYSVIEVR
jgi:transcription elongation factor GreA